ncbi:MAG: hypothetical protein KA313_03590 [Pseudarcicella sp.]|nr:hypothetical protein [Pseudarcicella sp.]MBP6410157.1 hypothetical protein [Pseudarcicella sp.]
MEQINTLQKITDFLDEISMPYNFTNIQEQTFLEGLKIEKGALLIDLEKLKNIGDILHEAGHIAVLSPSERATMQGSLENQQYAEASEMMAIAWSYAACLHIGIDSRVVFHPEGYKGDSENIVQNFSEGRYFGVPMLQWLGLTNEHYPQMTRWIREKTNDRMVNI